MTTRVRKAMVGWWPLRRAGRARSLTAAVALLALAGCATEAGSGATVAPEPASVELVAELLGPGRRAIEVGEHAVAAPAPATAAAVGLSPGDMVPAFDVLEPVAAAAAEAGTVSGEVTSQAAEATLVGSFDFDLDSGSVRMVNEFDVADVPDFPAELADEAGRARTELLILSDSAFVSLGEGFAPTPWVSLSPQAADALSRDLGQMRTVVGFDVLLARMDERTIITYEGAERLDGVLTDRWTLVEGSPLASGITRTSYWIGAGDLLLRQDGEGPVYEGSFSASYERWGESVDLRPPPPELVTRAS